jgi:hypothetical protein
MRDSQRRDELNKRVQRYAARGWYVEDRSDFQVTIAQGRDKLPNTVNLILTLATGGLWLIYWIFAEGKGRVLLTVNEAGEIREQLISGRYELKSERVSYEDVEAAIGEAAIGDEWEREERASSP